MSKITKAADAPEGELSYSFGMSSFSVSDDGEPFVTEDFVLIAQAEAEPWLKVEADATVEPAPVPVEAATSAAPQNAGEPVIETVTDPVQAEIQNPPVEVVNEAQAEAVHAPVNNFAPANSSGVTRKKS